MNPLPTESVIALAEAVPDRYHALVLCAAGQDCGKAKRLRPPVEHLDLLHKLLRVEQQLVQIKGDPEFGPPKTKASRRAVPLPEVVVDALASH